MLRLWRSATPATPYPVGDTNESPTAKPLAAPAAGGPFNALEGAGACESIPLGRSDAATGWVGSGRTDSAAKGRRVTTSTTRYGPHRTFMAASRRRGSSVV